MRRLREHFSNTPRPVYIDTMDKVIENYSNLLENKKIVDLKFENSQFHLKNGQFKVNLSNFDLKWWSLTQFWLENGIFWTKICQIKFQARKRPILSQKWPIQGQNVQFWSKMIEFDSILARNWHILDQILPI